MRPFAGSQTKGSSMLIRLLLGFLTVILLLVSFNFWSFSFFQTNIRNEIIRYNEQNIQFASQRYEEHVELVQKQMYALYFQDHVDLLRGSAGNARFEAYQLVKQELTRVISNPLLYVDNAVLVFKDDPQVLSKVGTNEKATFFEKVYASEDYPLSFWQEQFAKPYSSKLFPASRFVEYPFYPAGAPTDKGTFIPYIVKHWQNDDFYIVAMLDAGKLFNAFNRSASPSFTIMDEDDRVIFSAGGPGPENLRAMMPPDQSYGLFDNTYYFHRTDLTSRLSYVSAVPGESISEQVSRLNLTLLLLLTLALLVSVLVSVVFSLRFNNPVKQIINSIQGIEGAVGQVRTRIREFQLIGRKLDDMQKANAAIERDLMHQTTQLRAYRYLDKLKNIYNGSHGALEGLGQQAFRFIVFEISYRARFWEEMRQGPERLTYFIREFINQALSLECPRSLTFQAESRLIFSVVYDIDDASLDACLHRLLEAMKQDADGYFVTVAVSRMFPEASDYTAAYEQTVSLLQERILNEETQVVKECASREWSHLLAPAQERQFDTNLRAGNAQELLQLLDRHLAQLERRQGTVRQYREFTIDIVQKVRKTLHALRLDEQATESVIGELGSLQSFYSSRQYRMFFSQLLAAACEEIAGKQKNGDPIIDFVTEYVQAHYQKDITLDIVAEKLHITGGYLSTYFKEKTGEYFVDYINNVRIDKAKRMLLEQPGKKIQDIAQESGYQNINSFNRMFKKMSGMSPRDFRRLSRTEEAPLSADEG
ncbi:Helix-turn-helix domain-containing protein [Paenibacillus sp. UNCCL117]|uniref:AraC family transcriptional regulator n=1 Tax=unclassified Paenibacillus TaxID=185978 RepID=UPI000884A927|nr:MULTISPECIES: helix-turn-helix domain-containing protein [unclassified Paenibacillus]SDE40236.1 Helix-turn-helix domain-containing protein [Paenibacillus sp. cl123]SFW65312.1 Helix-turn-helix domain-containing protein [Paenibacillus sp. UNCCL117]